MNHIHTFDYRDTFEKIEIKRISVRAIIMRGDSILLVHLDKTNEYKFPGGGVKAQETYEEALRREVLEEAGAKIVDSKKCLGYVDQIWPDKYLEGEIFQMRNIYYICKIDDKQFEQDLDDYEFELGFKPVWVTLEEAIQKNNKRLVLGSDYHWTERTLFMLRYIKNGC